MRSTRSVLTLTLAWLSTLAAMVCSQAVAGQNPDIPAQVLSELRSGNPSARMQAFEVLRASPAILRSPNNTAEFTNLLERENQYVEAFYRANPNGEIGERFGDYISNVMDSLSPFRDTLNQHQLEVLARADYDGNSKLAIYLATKYGGRILPVVLNKSRSDVMLLRHEAVEMLGTIFSNYTQLSPPEVSAIRTAVRAAVGDKEVFVRQKAVQTLGKIGNSTDIPTLRELARSDPAELPESKVPKYRFPVRTEAQEAIDSIQKSKR